MNPFDQGLFQFMKLRVFGGFFSYFSPNLFFILELKERAGRKEKFAADFSSCFPAFTTPRTLILLAMVNRVRVRVLRNS